jgi:hypothetical protein
VSNHSHYGEYAEARHDHRGEYADDRHDHDLDYASKHHAHFNLEREDERLKSLVDRCQAELRELREDLEEALERIRVLDQLRPTCVVCLDAAATQQTVHGPVCSDCVGDPAEGTTGEPANRGTRPAAGELAAALRQVADRYTTAALTDEASDIYRAVAGELASAFHTLAGALGSRRAPYGEGGEL